VVQEEAALDQDVILENLEFTARLIRDFRDEFCCGRTLRARFQRRYELGRYGHEVILPEDLAWTDGKLNPELMMSAEGAETVHLSREASLPGVKLR